MKNSSPKKKKAPVRVRKQTMLTLAPEAKQALEEMAKATGKPMARIVESRILGLGEFSPDVEAYIARTAKAAGISRSQVLERAVVALMGKPV